MFCDVLFLLQMSGFTDSILARASKFYGLKERGQRSCYLAFVTSIWFSQVFLLRQGQV